MYECNMRAVGMALHRSRPSGAEKEQRAADLSRRKRILSSG